MWLTEKGISLVVLIIAITLTSLLGVGIVSFMGAKQKTLVPQAQTYQAYTIAHAGIEFAIRYAYDNKDDNDFPNSHLPRDPNEKIVTFGAGQFRINYHCAPDNSTVILKSIGEYQATGTTVATRVVELQDFSQYANIPLSKFCP